MRARVFALTWLSYASYYLTRKNFAAAKKTIETQLGVSRAELGRIDDGYLAAYAVGQFLWGGVGDRFGARPVLVLGMLATAACSVWFGSSSTVTVFALAFAVNGLAQATGWPNNVKVMGQHFPPEGRGRVMGLWSTCYQIGGLAASPIAGALLTWFAWRVAFFAPAAAVVAVALALLLWLPRTPGGSSAGSPDPAAVREARRQVYRSTLVWCIGAAYAFLKLIRYVLLFWLPYFMQDALGYSPLRATLASLAFELGGSIGAVTVGWLSDRHARGRRVGVAVACIVALSGALPLYGVAAPMGLAFNVAALALVGFCLFGPDTLLSGAAAQDLGGPLATATAAGLINGLGSIGPVFQGRLTAQVSVSWGWPALYTLLGGMALVAAVVLAPFALRRKQG